MAEAVSVELNDLQAHLRLRKAEVCAWIERVLEGEGVHSARISLVLTDDAAIRRINAQHLGHDWATDVVTFPLSSTDARPLQGEIVISTETARREAASRGIAAEAELALYVAHGLLHLCGYDDRTADEAAQMRDREAWHLHRLGRTEGPCVEPTAGPGGATCPR